MTKKYRRMRGSLFNRHLIGRFKYPFKYICSFFPCAVRFDFSRAKDGPRDHLDLLDALESLLNYAHNNLSSRYDFVDVKDIERRVPLKFARRWFVNRQSIRRAQTFNTQFSIALKHILLTSDDPWHRANATILINQGIMGVCAFQNVTVEGDTVFVGNNTFCEDVSFAKYLVTLRPAGCVAIHLSGSKSEAFAHYSPSPHYHEVLISDLKRYSARNAGTIKATVVTDKPDFYRDLLRSVSDRYIVTTVIKDRPPKDVIFTPERDAILLDSALDFLRAGSRAA